MTRATSSTCSFKAAAFAAAAVVAIEASLAWSGALCLPWFAGQIRPLPHFRFSSMARYAYLSECRLRRCAASGKPVVVFLGGSPTAGLDERYLEESFGRLGASPAIWAYPPAPYPLELLSLLDALRAVHPRVVALGLGPPTLAAYSGLRTTRLAYFPLTRRLLARLPGGAWRYPRLLARMALGNAVAAFRYRFLIREEIFIEPPGREGPRTTAQADALFPAAADELSLPRRRGLSALDEFFAEWRKTGVPLIVWDAPRSSDPSLPGRPISPEAERDYLDVMRGLSRKHGFRFIAREEQPRFSAGEFANALHLGPAGSARLTRFLAAEVAKSL